MQDSSYFIFWGFVGLVGLAGLAIEIFLAILVIRWVVKTLEEAEEDRVATRKRTDERQRASWLESKKRWDALSPEEKEKERKRQREREEEWEREQERERTRYDGPSDRDGPYGY